jgi:Uma2 family endonuclease
MSATASPPLPNSPRPIGSQAHADPVESLDWIRSHRIRIDPHPGTATEADCVRVTESEYPCELIDGTLVKKAVSVPESYLSHLLSALIGPFVLKHNLGMCTAPDGMFKMIRGNIREPDFSFTRHDRVPVPMPKVGGWCPDLCVEVLSSSNTHDEMIRKRREYFEAGCRLIWEIDPREQLVDVYVEADEAREMLDANGTLSGEDVLPGFSLPLNVLFGNLNRYYPAGSDDRT